MQVEKDCGYKYDLAKQLGDSERFFGLTITELSMVEPDKWDRKQNRALLEDSVLILRDLHAQVGLQSVQEHQAKHQAVQGGFFIHVLSSKLKSVGIAS